MVNGGRPVQVTTGIRSLWLFASGLIDRVGCDSEKEDCIRKPAPVIPQDADVPVWVRAAAGCGGAAGPLRGR